MEEWKTGEKLFVIVGLIVDGREYALVVVGQGDATALHYALGYAEKCGKADILEAGGAAALAERRHKIPRKASSMNVDAYPKHCAGVNHAVNASLAMVAHEKSAKLPPGFEEALCRIIPDTDFSIVVLQIGGRGATTNVAPLANDGIANVAVVSLVAEAEHHGIFDFATNFAERAKGGGAIDFGTHADLGVVARGKWRTNARTLHDFNVFAYVNRAGIDIDARTLNVGSRLNKNLGLAVGELKVADYAI